MSGKIVLYPVNDGQLDPAQLEWALTEARKTGRPVMVSQDRALLVELRQVLQTTFNYIASARSAGLQVPVDAKAIAGAITKLDEALK